MSDPSPLLQHLLSTLSTLYSPLTPPSTLPSLQQTLTTFQLSPHSSTWSLIPLLLSYPDPTVRFFGANTLLTKITEQGVWDELPGGQKEGRKSVKESVLNWLSRSAAEAYPEGGEGGRQGEKVVLRKLASATTALSLRIATGNGKGGGGEEEDGGEKWNDWLLEVMMRVAGGKREDGRGTSREATLEVLSVVVEQVDRAQLTGQKRIAYMSTFTSSIPFIVTTLSSSLTTPSTPTELSTSLTTFTSFLITGQFTHVELTSLYPLLLPHLLPSSPKETTLDSIKHPQTIINACTALEELIERSSGLSSSVGITKFINRRRTDELVLHWACSPFISAILQSALSDPEEAPEDILFLSISKLLCTLTEHLISFLFSPPPPPSAPPHLTLTSQPVQTLFHHLLSLTLFPGHSLPTYNLNELTSGVWLALQEESADVGLVSGDGEGREGREGREEEWEVVKGVFGALAGGLRVRAKRVGWEEGRKEWLKDAHDAFRTYRSTVLSETLLYTFYVLRETMLSGLVQLALSQLSSAQPDSSDSYEDLESTLFTLLTISESITPSPLSTPPLSTLFSPSFLTSLPSTNSHTLVSTALRLTGAYSTWFASLSSSREGGGADQRPLLTAVNFVVMALEVKELVPDAARSLRLLCDSNRRELVQHVGGFVSVLGGLEGRVEDSELVKVLESVSSVVQALPPDQLIDPLLSLTTPIITKLLSAISSFSTHPTPSRDLLLQQLSYLTSISRGLSDPEGDLVDLDSSFDDTAPHLAARGVLGDERVGRMREELGRALEGIARCWGEDTEVVSQLATFIHVTTSDALPTPLSLDTFSLYTLSTSFSRSVWMGMSTSLLARLARDQNDGVLDEGEVERVARVSERGLRGGLEVLGVGNAMEENPDVVAAFLGYCSAIIRHFPRIFIVLPNYLDAVISFAERGLTLQEKFSLKATIDLLISTLQQTRMASLSSTTFHSTLLPHVPTLLSAILLCIAGLVPRSNLTSLSELLHAMLLRLPVESKAALKELLSREGWPNERVGREVKEKFEKGVTSARTGKIVRQVVSDFALVCRGLDGSAYGAASASAF